MRALLLVLGFALAGAVEHVLRPNLYFGTRTRSVDGGVFTGLMYFDKEKLSQLRHECSDGDDLKRWGWTLHDGNGFGEQKLRDDRNGVSIAITYLRKDDQNWGISIRGKSIRKLTGTQSGRRLNVLFYVYVEGEDSFVRLHGLDSDTAQYGIEGQNAAIDGNSSRTGVFTIRLKEKQVESKARNLSSSDVDDEDDTYAAELCETHLKLQALSRRGRGRGARWSQVIGNRILKSTHYTTTYWPDQDSLWDLKNLIVIPQLGRSINKLAIHAQNGASDDDELKATPDRICPLLSNVGMGNEDIEDDDLDESDEFVVQEPQLLHNANVAVLQRIVKPDFQLDIMFSSSPSRYQDDKWFSGKNLKARKDKVKERFENVFQLEQTGRFESWEINAARAALGNCLGSHGFFVGKSIIWDGNTFVEEEQATLFTGVPSRSFFPRGFLWDEGFHQLLVSHWNVSISVDVITHWLNRMNEDGWIAREQILGPEALSKVPERFRIQNPKFANPPVLSLAVENLLLQTGCLSDDDDDIHNDQSLGICKVEQPEYVELVGTFLRDVGYPKLFKQYKWFKRTQKAGNGLSNTFVWRGRSEDGKHTLTSGIDDYPRGRIGDPTMEAHVDLLSWITWTSIVLTRIATYLQYPKEEIDALKEDTGVFVESLLSHHWNRDIGFFSDVGTIDEYYPHPLPKNGPDRASTLRSGLLPHVGYVGLIPFVLKLVPEDRDDIIAQIVDKIHDPNHLWSSHGLRSLSKSDVLYGKEEDYWRGAVWININYLAVKALHHYGSSAILNNVNSTLATRCLQVERELRSNIITNVLNRYKSNGFFFENYHGDTGLGRGTKPFTGWTALVVLLMAGK